MDHLWLGNTFALIGEQPVRYSVTLIPLRASSSDRTLRIPVAYKFSPSEGPGESHQGDLYVRVYDDVFREEPKVRSNLHRYVIRFAIRELRSNLSSREVSLENDAFQAVQTQGRLAGTELRDTIIRFYYRVNAKYPLEGLSWPEILENYNADESEVQRWIRYWLEAERLKAASSVKRYDRDGMSTTSFYINPARVQEVERELRVTSSAVDDNNQAYNHFKIITIEPDQLPNGFVFYMTEFRGESLSIFENTVKPYCKDEFNLDVVISKEDRLPNQIDDKVISHIHKCRFAIADITTRNPNVMYEIGFAHAIGKDVIIVCNRNAPSKEVFDIRNIDTVWFSDTNELLQELREKLEAILSLHARL